MESRDNQGGDGDDQRDSSDTHCIGEQSRHVLGGSFRRPTFDHVGEIRENAFSHDLLAGEYGFDAGL